MNRGPATYRPQGYTPDVAEPEPAAERANSPAPPQETSTPKDLSPAALLESFDKASQIVEEGRRIAIRKNGRTIAGLVSASDLAALESLEDLLDELDARDAFADYRENGGVSFKEVMSEFGL